MLIGYMRVSSENERQVFDLEGVREVIIQAPICVSLD